MIGVVFQIEGSYADVSFVAATRLPKSHFGEYLGRGEVGEFVLIDVGGSAAFGRLLRVGAPTTNADILSQSERRLPADGRIQLLSTLHLDGRSIRGIVKYPKVGDPVYAASAEAILSVLGAVSGPSRLVLGRLSVDESVEVAVPLSRLFGRHLAIVGSTGSGKSWTMGHIAESTALLGGKMILIDATGEFHTLGSRATHLAFGALDDEPDRTKLVGIPHHMMRESDRSAFLNPSSGTQLPKLREAIRTLRLAHAIANDVGATGEHRALVADGTIRKTGIKIATFGGATRKYGSTIEDPHAAFDIKLIGTQIQWECVWPSDKNRPDCFGSMDYTQIGYVSTLVSRINDLLQTPEVMQVIDPQTGTLNVIDEIASWIDNPGAHLLRLSLRNLTFANHLREIVVNILGQALLARARSGAFRVKPLVVAVDEAHQFFDVTVGDEFSSSRLNAFDSIAKEGRKYGLTVCVATQRPGDLPAGVLSQVGMTIVHRLADGRDRQRVEQAAAELDHSATRLLPGLVPGEAILMGVDFPVPVSVRISRPVAPPASDGPRYSSWGPGESGIGGDGSDGERDRA
ncbi:ATP-binding protein [Cellulomonas sp. P24]|uniref:ATP-binding protein n=1 Tax=Cellulomonas sp. P24 TaxID=2885206 RepID=UPI00216B0869|nr:ATP-binding protein [Cellulomonas sp. P24]MCR6494504.1 ATP-binding protein [Cellulomonas sp. P24]